MKAFMIDIHTDNLSKGWPTYVATLGEAKRIARSPENKALRADMTISEIEVSTDKTGIINLLNEVPVLIDTGRSWTVTARGKAESKV